MAGGRPTEGRTGAYGGGTPWIFTGRALYQLHLVKAEVAQPFIPPELKLVQAFGYTLGGLYLARYSGSPAGVFDELVVIAGIVWNAPTSCAWAAKVLVNSEEACDHGRKVFSNWLLLQEVGLPSQCAKFSQTSSLTTKNQPSWWNIASKFQSIRSFQSEKEQTRSSKGAVYKVGFHIEVEDGNQLHSLCHIALPRDTVIQNELSRDNGPCIRMSLPSFSGKTKLQPELLKYSCDLQTRIRIVRPAVVTSTETTNCNDKSIQGPGVRKEVDNSAGVKALLTSKPIFAMHFDHMFMEVESPTLVSPKKATSSAEIESTGVLQPVFSNRK